MLKNLSNRSQSKKNLLKKSLKGQFLLSLRRLKMPLQIKPRPPKPHQLMTSMPKMYLHSRRQQKMHQFPTFIPRQRPQKPRQFQIFMPRQHPQKPLQFQIFMPRQRPQKPRQFQIFMPRQHLHNLHQFPTFMRR